VIRGVVRGQEDRAVHTELEDVFLRDPDVLEELPRRVLEAGRAGAALVGRNAGDSLVEADMRVFPVEDARKLIAECRARFAHTEASFTM
jgi:hypothetical protein